MNNVRIIKLDFNDGSSKYQIRIGNIRGGWEPFIHNGKEVLYDTFDEAISIVNPEEKCKPFVINETTVYER
jgi:hypothetical protein